MVADVDSARLDLSPLQPFADWDELARLRADPPPGDPRCAEGLMLKRWDSPYLAGRPRGPWFKWKRDPKLVDAVLMYAQRGHGKRSSFYSDYTFGVWREDEAGVRSLTPVGKAYFGFTDEELKRLDAFVRDNTVERFGPVRAVRADHDFGLVLEVAFEGLQRSTRHKSGLAMRFPRISRIRWDKPARDAGRLASPGADAGGDGGLRGPIFSADDADGHHGGLASMWRARSRRFAPQEKSKTPAGLAGAGRLHGPICVHLRHLRKKALQPLKSAEDGVDDAVLSLAGEVGAWGGGEARSRPWPRKPAGRPGPWGHSA